MKYATSILVFVSLALYPLCAATTTGKPAQNDKAGEEMKAGANHVARASDWSGNKLESEAKTVLKKASELSGKLIHGASLVPEEVGKGIESLGSEINRLGQKLEKKKPESQGSASL